MDSGMEHPEDQVINLTSLNIPTDTSQDIAEILGYLVFQSGGMIVVPNPEEIKRILEGRTLAIRWDSARDEQCILTLVKADDADDADDEDNAKGDNGEDS
jgi:hypothetical protein